MKTSGKTNYKEALDKILNESVEDFGNYDKYQKALMEAVEKADKYDEIIKEIRIRRLVLRSELSAIENLDISKVGEYIIYCSLLTKTNWITSKKS